MKRNPLRIKLEEKDWVECGSPLGNNELHCSDELKLQINQDCEIVNVLKEGDTILSEKTMIEIGQSKLKLLENQRTEKDKQNEQIVNRLEERIKELQDDTHYDNPKFVPMVEDSYYPVYKELQKIRDGK